MDVTNLLKTKFVLILILSLSLSCSKFEDGPAFSLLSVKNRIARQWKIEYVMNLGTGIRHSADYEGWLFTLDKGGSFTQTVFYNQTETTYVGNWDLLGENQLKMEYETPAGTKIEFYTILRLTKKEFWLKDKFQEIHYYSE